MWAGRGQLVNDRAMIPKIIEKLSKSRPSSEWIRNKSGLAWLNLEMSVPFEQIYQEWLTVSSLAVAHREGDSMGSVGGHRGWKSLTIHGVSPEITTHNDLQHRWTSIGEACKSTKQWLEKNFILEEAGRIRFMLLEPGGYILPHADTDKSSLVPVNVAITNPVGAEFHMLNRGKVPFAPGLAFMLDLSNQHWVVNQSSLPRLHIIVHALPRSNIIERSYANLCYRN